MPTCYECGDHLAPTAGLACSDSEEVFCRDPYHGHTSETVGGVESEGSNAVSSRGTRNVEHPMSIIGYFIAVVLMAIGLIYFSREAYVIVAGEGGIEALQAAAHLVLAGALFSLATFIMVATYIAGQS